MTYSEIFPTIVEILRRLIPEDHRDVKITDSTRVVEELDIHSILFVELIVELEDTFKIKIKPSLFEKIVTVADVVNFVASTVLERKVS